MSRTFRIRHSTQYRYDNPVSFGPHRLLLRPRDGHDLRVIETALTISPTATVRWQFDTFGNSVAIARFDEPATALTVESTLVLRRYALDPGTHWHERRSGPYPVVYSDEEAFDLSPLMTMGEAGERGAVEAWLDASLPQGFETAFEFLRALSNAIYAAFQYSSRDELGTQSAATTIASGGGTCRDFAWLFIEAARARGYAARFVTGYLYDAGAEGALLGGGATHAWAEAFVPGIGWTEFDPTNRIVGGAALIRVAATRTPAQASPIKGSYAGDGASYQGMTVEVSVEEVG